MKRPFWRTTAIGWAVAALGTGCGGATKTMVPTPAPRSQGAPISPAAIAAADQGRPPYTAADVHFMSGMIGHHAQAVLMAGWAPSHAASAAIRALSERIVVGQRDEIGYMQRWLRDRKETVPSGDPAETHRMGGMDHGELMPGMLTAEQMNQLDQARGPDFDRLFLKYMIQHHQGALTMVSQLLAASGGQDEDVFKFLSDVNADQTTEIDFMGKMLAALTPGGSQ